MPGVPAPSHKLLKCAPPKPKTYGGDEEKLPARRWLSSMEQYFVLTGIVEEGYQVLYAASHLEGPAVAWWDAVRANGMPGWSEFKSGLLAHFSPLEPVRLSYEKLLALQQRTSVQEFTRQFRLICLELPELSDMTKMYIYINGLKRHLQREVLLRHPTSFSDAAEKAELMDRIFVSVRPDQVMRPAYGYARRTRKWVRPGAERPGERFNRGRGRYQQGRPFAPRGAGGTQKRFSGEGRDNGRGNGRGYGRGNGQGNGNGRGDGPNTKPIVCWSCGEEGHMSRECPKSEKKLNFGGKGPRAQVMQSENDEAWR